MDRNVCQINFEFHYYLVISLDHFENIIVKISLFKSSHKKNNVRFMNIRNTIGYGSC